MSQPMLGYYLKQTGVSIVTNSNNNMSVSNKGEKEYMQTDQMHHKIINETLLYKSSTSVSTYKFLHTRENNEKRF